MRRLTGIEKKAALVVIGLAVMAAESGYRLLKKHTAYMTKKAAAAFDEKEKTQEEKDLEAEAMSYPAEDAPQAFSPADAIPEDMAFGQE